MSPAAAQGEGTQEQHNDSMQPFSIAYQPEDANEISMSGRVEAATPQGSDSEVDEGDSDV